MPTINELAEELLDRYREVAALQGRVIYAYNVEDSETSAGQIGFPMVAVTYERSEPKQVSSNSGVATGRTQSASMTVHRFVAIVMMEYNNALQSQDTKVVATDLLDGARSAVLGYRGVNKRPWVWQADISVDSGLQGVVSYGQIWETDVPVLGTFEPN